MYTTIAIAHIILNTFNNGFYTYIRYAETLTPLGNIYKYVYALSM